MATIIVEDGTGTNPAANSYVSVADFDAYAAERGINIAGQDHSVLIILAMDYVELQNYLGSRTSADQPLEFPRDGSNVIPEKIKKAVYEVALLIDQGVNFFESVGQRVLSESVSGAVSVTYSDKGAQIPTYPHVTNLLREFITAAVGSANFAINRI